MIGRLEIPEQQNLKEMRKNIEPGTELHVVVDSIASWDGEMVLLGGSYRTPAHAYRSLLLRSLDGGKSWSEIEEWMTGCHVGEIYFFDAMRAWFITAWSVEGTQAPYYIFRSADKGKPGGGRQKCHAAIHHWPRVTDFFFESPLRGDHVRFDGGRHAKPTEPLMAA